MAVNLEGCFTERCDFAASLYVGCNFVDKSLYSHRRKVHTFRKQYCKAIEIVFGKLV